MTAHLFSQVLVLVGLALIVAGVAVWFPPALAAVGVAVLVFGLFGVRVGDD